MAKNKRNRLSPAPDEGSETTGTTISKVVENTAVCGMLIICVGLMIPLFNLSTPGGLDPFKWIYSAGAAIFLVARLVGATDRKTSLRVRRIRRMEFWAGICFAAGAFFWFWKESHLGLYAGPLAVVRDTILFSLAGACIQVIASWLLYYSEKKAHKSESKQ